jgi:hypothetical protein
MRNNNKTSAIDCRGYISTFDMILSPMFRFWLLKIGTGFNWAGGIQKRGGSEERVAAMTRKLG